MPDNTQPSISTAKTMGINFFITDKRQRYRTTMLQRRRATSPPQQIVNRKSQIVNSRGSPFQKWDQTGQELPYQPDGDQHAREIRRQPAGIPHVLQHTAAVIR